MPMERAFQLGQGEGPIGIVGPISQPRGTIDTASLTLERTNALVVLFSEPTLIWAAKGDQFPHEWRDSVTPGP